MNSWPPKLGGTIHVGPQRWRVAAFGIRDGERWVMAIRRGVVNLMPWVSIKADQSYAAGQIKSHMRWADREFVRGVQ